MLRGKLDDLPSTCVRDAIITHRERIDSLRSRRIERRLNVFGFLHVE